ncbi:type VI secretion system baseplate subunit TssF [Taylorella equigenitalis]|uniref:type VI secretion system baseplate subunit TssF n=1 Tax=Taylorella equigenitalis TaxID=29575 RepID=UPI0004030946|nr:type VI secretion system baseplate subunit TssF [Taylorella equigenitalis]WDU46492.1 type VI secretion system baseplate subunit TssF [Taylorella equigenitalis]
MENDFIEYYNRELAYIREMGREFAEQYPKVASRLGMEGIQVPDPYVERLMEGFSFLTARIHKKMDAEFPQFTQNLLEVLYPHYVSPTPAIGIIDFDVNSKKGDLVKGYTLPKGTVFRARTGGKECRFSTGSEVTFHPLVIEEAEVTSSMSDLPPKLLKSFRGNKQIRSALRVQIKVVGGSNIADLKNFNKLNFFLNGEEVYTHKLLEMLMAHTIGIVVHDNERPVRWTKFLDVKNLKHEGFETNQSLLPTDSRVFQGYRLLHEYFAFPYKYLYVSLSGIQQAITLPEELQKQKIKSFEVTFLFDKIAHDLEGVITAENLRLHSVPVINLFPMLANRINILPNAHEYHVVVDKAKPLDYEIYSLTKVTVNAPGAKETKEFRPFFDVYGAEGQTIHQFYSVRREARKASLSANQISRRTGYRGSEIFISIVDVDNPPYDNHTVFGLNIETMSTNRDLPYIFNSGGDVDFRFNVSVPVDRISFIKKPTRTRAPIGREAYSWRLINHLNLNYLNLLDSNEESGAEAVRELLHIYSDLGDPMLARQIQGIRSIKLEPIYRRMPVRGSIVFGRGVSIKVLVDENEFAGISPYLFGSILDQFFSRHVSINMLTELELSSLQSGLIATWKPRLGGRPTV